MGLDINVYRRLEKTEKDGEAFRLYINDSFPERADNIEDGAYYTCEDSLDFRAGSYGGYNHWRDTLAKLAGYPLRKHGEYADYAVGAQLAEGGPFWELIQFSDCEGIIGPTTSAKLAKDFADYQDRADNVGDERWKKLYANFREAFEMASDNGAVEFR